MISTVIASLLRFKSTCRDFGVSDPENVTVLATEATRTAVNSKEYLEEIRLRTGWGVQLLAKEEEGRVGAMGVASSDEEVEGLVMDLGGMYRIVVGCHSLASSIVSFVTSPHFSPVTCRLFKIFSINQPPSRRRLISNGPFFTQRW